MNAHLAGELAILEELHDGMIELVTAMDEESLNEGPVTVGWCVAHTVGHAGEHWGQIQLNRDLYRART